MSIVETKKDIIEEFSGVKYILTSGMRSKLLLAVYENPKNLDELRTELKKPSATILHGLKELETINLIKKVQKYYELTSNGFILTTNMVKLIENWYSINRNKLFWNSHDLSGIPDEILKDVYQLKNAEYVTSTTCDLSNAFNTYIQLISKAKRLKIILPIYSENHFKHLIKLLNGNKLKNLELIVSEEIINSMAENELFNKELLNNQKVKIRCVKRRLKLFLTQSEEFMSLTLFFKDGHYDDSQILIAKDQCPKMGKKFKKILQGRKYMNTFQGTLENWDLWSIQDKELLSLIVGRSGGKTTSRIIDLILKKPMNKNMIAKILNLDYIGC